MPEYFLRFVILPFVEPDGRVHVYGTVEVVYRALSCRVILCHDCSRKHFSGKSRTDTLSYLIGSDSFLESLHAAVRKCNVNHIQHIYRNLIYLSNQSAKV